LNWAGNLERKTIERGAHHQNTGKTRKKAKKIKSKKKE